MSTVTKFPSSGEEGCPTGGVVAAARVEYAMQTLMNKEENKNFRQSLRNHSTAAESALWQMLKGRQLAGLKFRRQQGIGPYVVDFYCPKLKLAIELDGETHATRSDYDEQRSVFLATEKGICVLRFENRVVFESPWRIFDEIMGYLGEQRE